MNDTSTMTTEAKQSLKEKVLVQRNAVIKQMNHYIDDMGKIESEYEKYFDEIKKHSSDFTLTKTVRRYSKDVYFRMGMDHQPILVDTIEKSYNECRISYVGKLPEKKTNTITIEVEEHKTSGRRCWSSTNHGFKLKLRLNYDKEIYYKSVKTFIKKITDFVNDKWVDYDYQILLEKKKTMALNYARVQFNTNNISMMDCSTIKVVYENGTEIRVTHNVNVETGEIKLTLSSVRPPKNTNNEVMINFVNSLGSL
jgi:hypothetical protein